MKFLYSFSLSLNEKQQSLLLRDSLKKESGNHNADIVTTEIHKA